MGPKAAERSTMHKQIWKPIDVRNFGSDVNVRPSVRTDSGGGESKATRRGWRMPSFLGGKSRGAFGQPAFFLPGNRMTLVAFEKGLKRVSKTIVRQFQA